MQDALANGMIVAMGYARTKGELSSGIGNRSGATSHLRMHLIIAWLLLGVACFEGFWLEDALIAGVAEVETIEVEVSSVVVRIAGGVIRRPSPRPDGWARFRANLGDTASTTAPRGAVEGKARPLDWGRGLLHRHRRLLI